MKLLKLTTLSIAMFALVGAAPTAFAQANNPFNSDGTRKCELEPENYRERCEARNKAIRACAGKKMKKCSFVLPTKPKK